jgi:hypothetical protein
MHNLYYILFNDNDIIDISVKLDDLLNKLRCYRNSPYIKIFNNNLKYVIGTINYDCNGYNIITYELFNSTIDDINNTLSKFNKNIKFNNDIFIKSNSEEQNSILNINIPANVFINNNDLINNLEEKINNLIKLKDNELSEINNIENKISKDQKNYESHKLNIFNLKKNLKVETDKWNAFLNKFRANKKVYYMLKNENKDDIPELFKHEYPIFKQLDDLNMIHPDVETNEEIRMYYNIQSNEKLEFSHNYNNLFNSNILAIDYSKFDLYDDE